MSAKAKKGCDRLHQENLTKLLTQPHTNRTIDPSISFACYATSVGGFNGGEATGMSAMEADGCLESDCCIFVFGALGFRSLRGKPLQL